MNKSNVIEVRDAFKEAGVKIQVFGDNSNVYDERYDVFIWDDTKELLYVIQRVKTQSVFEYSDPDVSAFYSILEYDIIQYIQAVSNVVQLKSVLPTFGTETAARRQNIINWVSETDQKRIDVKPGTDTKETLAATRPTVFDEVYGKGAAEIYLAEKNGTLLILDNNSTQTLQQMINTATNGQIIRLKKNVSENITVPLGKNITLDLAGKTLNIVTSKGLNVLGNLSITDTETEGKIICEGIVAVVDGENATITLNGGRMESTNNYGIFAKNCGTFIINDGMVVSKYPALSGNGNMGDMNFEINGGNVITEQGPAIYMPAQGKLTITDGKINGGISLRMGQVNISGGYIGSIIDNIDDPKEGYNYGGCAFFPDALFVMGGTYTSTNATYGNSLNLTITGGTIECRNKQGSAIAIYDIAKVEQTMNVKLSSNAKLKTDAVDRHLYDILTLEDIGVTSPVSGCNNSAYVGKVSTQYI